MFQPRNRYSHSGLHSSAPNLNICTLLEMFVPWLICIPLYKYFYHGLNISTRFKYLYLAENIYIAVEMCILWCEYFYPSRNISTTVDILYLGRNISTFVELFSPGGNWQEIIKLLFNNYVTYMGYRNVSIFTHIATTCKINLPITRLLRHTCLLLLT